MIVQLLIFIIIILVYFYLNLKKIKCTKNLRFIFLLLIISNSLGLFLTLTSPKNTIYSDGLKIKRQNDEDKSLEFKVYSDKERGKIYVNIPKLKEDEEEKSENHINKTFETRINDEISTLNENNKDKSYFYLPKTLEGKKLYWEKEYKSNGIIISFLGIILSFGLVVKKRQEELNKKKLEERELLLEYPNFIMKFVLLIEAGLSISQAFYQIYEDYSKKSKKNILFEKLRILCNQLKGGDSQLKCYNDFGKNCNQIKYRTFVTLLVQSSTRGNNQLLNLLEREAIEAFEDRKRQAKIMGEIASTKLLIPMIIMLIIVMALVMIPAFFSM